MVPSSRIENSTSSPSPMCSARLISSGSVSWALGRTLTRALNRGSGSIFAVRAAMSHTPKVALSDNLSLPHERSATPS